jgi:hypothetical protein
MSGRDMVMRGQGWDVVESRCNSAEEGHVTMFILNIEYLSIFICRGFVS